MFVYFSIYIIGHCVMIKYEKKLKLFTSINKHIYSNTEVVVGRFSNNVSDVTDHYHEFQELLIALTDQ